MSISGYRIGDSNPRLRFLVIVFVGTILFGFSLLARERIIYSEGFIDVSPPVHHQPKEAVNTSVHTDELRKELKNGQN
jgi:hypothetical protein